MNFSEEDYNKAKQLLASEEYKQAKNVVYRYEAQLEAEKQKKRNKCDHNWVTNETSPPYERTFYCTKCGLQEDGYGEQW